MNQERKAKPFDLKAYLKNVLRRASYRHSARSEALKRARTARNTYTCNDCKQSFPNKSVAVDHLQPVVNPETGFTTWDDYIARLFCGPDLLQVLCDTCHDAKTAREREIRKATKARKAA